MMILDRQAVHSPLINAFPILSVHQRSNLHPGRGCGPRLTAILKSKSPTVSKRFEVCCSFGVNDFAQSASIVRTISTLVSSLTFILGAVMIGQQLLAPEQDRFELRDRCPRCKGTGLEPCFCTRWSDGDFGCETCNQTGSMRCSACGGGGKAIPLSVYVKKHNNKNNRT